MLTVTNSVITLTRGDTARIAVDLADGTGDAYEMGADGSEEHPYAFEPGTECVPNAFYTSPKKYVYMPADAERHSYDSWDDAAANMVEW